MEESRKLESFETSLATNIWMQRYNLIAYLMALVGTILVNLSIPQLFMLLLGVFLFTGIALFGFIGLYAHALYYFRYEVNRKVELYTDKILTYKSNQRVQVMFKNEIDKIVLRDKVSSEGFNLYPSNSDSYYYLIIIGKNKEQIILTCLLDISLRKKIAAWYGRDLEHKYQFFPFPA